MKANDYLTQDRVFSNDKGEVVCHLHLAIIGKFYFVYTQEGAKGRTYANGFSSLKDANSAFSSEVKRLKSL